MNLHQAIRDGHTEKAIKLINKGADIEAIDCNKDTPLGLAISMKNIEIVEFLLCKGANINASDESGYAFTRGCNKR